MKTTKSKEYKSYINKISLVKEPSLIKNVKITSSTDAYNYCKQFYFGDLEIYESMFLLLLNSANNTTGYAKISQGGISGTVLDIKIILKYALESLASGIILCHNHPSGNTEPSEADKKITNKLKEACKLMDITLLDHVIITKENFTSFADEGLM